MSERYTLPRVSMPVIIEILGEIYTNGIELLESLSCHF